MAVKIKLMVFWLVNCVVRWLDTNVLDDCAASNLYMVQQLRKQQIKTQ